MLRCEAVVPAKSSMQLAHRCWCSKYLKKRGRHLLCKIHLKMAEQGIPLKFSKEEDGAAGF